MITMYTCRVTTGPQIPFLLHFVVVDRKPPTALCKLLSGSAGVPSPLPVICHLTCEAVWSDEIIILLSWLALPWSGVVRGLYCTVLYCTVLYCTDRGMSSSREDTRL